jgi:16S rRNA (uracil1498-N3)-methyltransferase
MSLIKSSSSTECAKNALDFKKAALDRISRRRRRRNERVSNKVIQSKNRVVLKEREIDLESNTVELKKDDERYKHVRDVLKKTKEGDKFKVTVLNRGLGVGAVVDCGNESLRVEVKRDDDGDGSELKKKNVEIRVLLACPRPKVLKRMLCHFAMFDIKCVYLFSAEKTERCYFQSDALKEETIEREFTRGVEQNAVSYTFPRVAKCRGLREVLEELIKEDFGGIEGVSERLGSIEKGVSFEWIFNNIKTTSTTTSAKDDDEERKSSTRLNLLAHPKGSSITETIMRNRNSENSNSQILLAIGPEGGWTDLELGIFSEFDFSNVGLGNKIFTTDVATIALLSSICETLDVW